jgi:hypothetical protein
VSGTAIGGNGGGSNGPGGPGASVSLTSNGGVNDAVGGATSGTLNLTQTATGGSGRTGGSATSTLIGTNPFNTTFYNLTANATGGNGFGSFGGIPGGAATATADATTSPTGGIDRKSVV